MSDLHDKVIQGLEKIAVSCQLPLTIDIAKSDSGALVIRFMAGDAMVQTLLSTFIRHPKIVMDPFVEEIIKRTL